MFINKRLENEHKKKTSVVCQSSCLEIDVPHVPALFLGEKNAQERMYVV